MTKTLTYLTDERRRLQLFFVFLLLGIISPLGTIPFAGISPKCWAQSRSPSPHIPTEQELRERLSGGRKDELQRDYQRDSVESFGTTALSVLDWIKQHLSAIHLTPARMLLGLGVLGNLYTWNKNKHKVQWAVLSTFSVLLMILGIAAMIFSWPYMN